MTLTLPLRLSTLQRSICKSKGVVCLTFVQLLWAVNPWTWQGQEWKETVAQTSWPSGQLHTAMLSLTRGTNALPITSPDALDSCPILLLPRHYPALLMSSPRPECTGPSTRTTTTDSSSSLLSSPSSTNLTGAMAVTATHLICHSVYPWIPSEDPETRTQVKAVYLRGVFRSHRHWLGPGSQKTEGGQGRVSFQTRYQSQHL